MEETYVKNTRFKVHRSTNQRRDPGFKSLERLLKSASFSFRYFPPFFSSSGKFLCVLGAYQSIIVYHVWSINDYCDEFGRKDEICGKFLEGREARIPPKQKSIVIF